MRVETVRGELTNYERFPHCHPFLMLNGGLLDLFKLTNLLSRIKFKASFELRLFIFWSPKLALVTLKLALLFSDCQPFVLFRGKIFSRA
jgi:hypothetical protein